MCTPAQVEMVVGMLSAAHRLSSDLGLGGRKPQHPQRPRIEAGGRCYSDSDHFK
jgi:hypothetical protein